MDYQIRNVEVADIEDLIKINDYLKYEKNIISILKNNDLLDLRLNLYDLPPKPNTKNQF